MAERAEEQSLQLRSPPRSDTPYLRTAAQLSASQSTGSYSTAWTQLPFLHVLAPNIAEPPSHGPHSASFPCKASEASSFAPIRLVPRSTEEAFPQTPPGAKEEFEDEDAEGSVYDDTELVDVDPEFIMDEDEDAEGDEEMQLFSGDVANSSSAWVHEAQERPLEHPHNDWLNPTYVSGETRDHTAWQTMDIPPISSARGFTPGTEAQSYDSDPPMFLFSPLEDYCFSAPALSATSSSSSSSPASFIPHSTQVHIPHSLHPQGTTKNDATRLWRPDWDKPWVSHGGHSSHPAVVYGHAMY